MSKGTPAEPRRIFLDTEFTNLPWTGHSKLLWLGLADDTGHSWSAINADAVIDECISDFVRDTVVPLMTADEARLTEDELAAAARSFCGDFVDEFWAYGPTVAHLVDGFGLGSEGEAAHERYWDWDLQLLRQLVDPWPRGWTATMIDLNPAAREAGIKLPANDSAHNPRHDALWNLEVWRMLAGASD